MKKEINLKLKMSELIYDVQNKTYLTGKSLSNGENHSHVANMQANDDDENAAQVLRSITSAFAILRNKFAEYLDNGISISNNDSMTEENDMSLTLVMPSNFNNSVSQTIGDAAHQFIVAYATADWFAITAKGETTDYTGVAAESLKIIEETLAKRCRPKRNG